MKRKLPVLLFISLVAVLLASGCVRAASPRGWAQPVQAGDVLLVSTHTGKLDGINPTTGDRIWRFPDDWTISDKSAQKLQGIYGQPQVLGDTVYVADYNGFVYQFKPSEAATDKSAKKQVGIERLNGAVVGGMDLDAKSGVLYVGTDTGFLYALDVTKMGSGNGNVFPPFSAGDRIWAAPLVSGGTVYVATTAGKLFALDATSGKPSWERPFSASAALVTTPVMAGGTVLVGGFGRTLYAVDASTGKEKWHFEATDWIWSKPLVDGDRVYVADFSGKVFAVSLTDGQTLWDAPFSAGEPIRSSPALSGGVLVVGDDKGEVFGVDAASGKSQWGPVVVGSTLQADLLGTPTSATVYLAPSGCLGADPDRAYYYKVNTSTHERQSTGTVC